MKFYTLAILVLTQITVSLAQYGFADSISLANPCKYEIGNLRPISPLLNNPFCWQAYELEVDTTYKAEIFNKLKAPEKLGEYMYYDPEDEVYDSSSLIRVQASNIHIIDYNQDGLPDFVSSLWVPWGKTLYTEFWRNNGESWEFDIRIEGQIAELGYDSITNTPWFRSYHKLCCGDYTNYLYTFKLSENEWMISERIALVGQFPRDIESLKPRETILLTEADTLFAFRSYGGVRIMNHPLFRYQFKPVAIPEAGLKGEVYFQYQPAKDIVMKFVLLQNGTSFTKSVFEKDHRIRHFSDTVKSNMVTYYCGWIWDAKR